jgi:hypothetical protein
MQDTITRLKESAIVRSRFTNVEGHQIIDELEVIHHDYFKNDFEEIPEHIQLSWGDDSAIIWIDDSRIEETADGWFTFEDGVYGKIEFQFIA